MATQKKLKLNKYGWKADKPDIRDLKFALPSQLINMPLPRETDLRPGCPKPYDQKDLGSCSGQSISGLIHYNLIKQDSRKAFQPSAMFIYYNERVLENSVNDDSGAELRDGIKSLVRWGVCPEQYHPYVISKFKLKPSKLAFKKALPHRISQYMRIRQDIDYLRFCLADGNPFIFGFMVYESFESDAVVKTGVLNMPGPREKDLGGHAVCLSGNTKISLLNGEEINIKELSETHKDRTFWVYSCDKDHNICPGLAYAPRKTGTKETVKVLLDNGEEVCCTKDHLFLMRDGSYKEAGSLVQEDSFMPLYQKNSNHKVVGVENGDVTDVYDLTVDKYHNFALSAGVFVHNCAVGYDDSKERFIIRNSYGIKWGMDGYFTMPYDYVINDDLAADFWTIKQIPNE